MRANMKKLLAVLMALTVVLSFAACGKTEKPETKESTTISEDADATTDNGEEVNAEADDEEDVEDNKTDSAKKTTKKSTGKTTKSSAKTTTKKSGSKTTKKDGKKTTKSGSKKTTKSDSKKTTKSDGKKTTKANKMSQAEILKLYATATEKAQMAKSFNKKRSTVSNSEIPGLYKSQVQKFLGIGEKNIYENKSEDGEIYTWKDKDDQIRFCVTKSALTEKDIKSATIKEDGGNYIVTIKVKDGSSSSGKNGEGAKNNSPVDRCGICTGERDIDIYDHKTAEICCKAGGSLISNAEEKTSNVVVTATINKSSGKLTNLKIKFDIDANLKALGKPINATGTTTVTVKNFKY